MNNLEDKKIIFRKKQIIVRKNLFTNVTKVFNEDLFEEFFTIIDDSRINVISSFVSINTEINTAELNNYIIKKNKILCLPVIIKKK